MRYVFGLVGLLVVFGVLLMIWSQTQVPVIKTGRVAQIEAARIAGQDEQGVRASDSITLSPTFVNGALRSMRVDGLMSAGPMQSHFGLQKDDEIIAIIDRGVTLHVREQDEDMAKGLILQAYQTRGQLVVLRQGQRLTLPADAGQ